MKYQIGQEVWFATWAPTKTYVECPDCAGTGRIRVLMADDTMVSIECAGCSRGYEPPTGYIQVYNRQPRAKHTTVIGVEIRDGKTEWRTTETYCADDGDLFDNEADALERAQEKAAQHDREERERIAQKEKPTRTWAWNAHYHRREIKEAQRRIEYHTAKLAAANLKAKQERTKEPAT